MQAKESTSTNTVKRREFVYERIQKAGRMETIMALVTVIAVIGAIFALLSYGWWPSLALLILGSLAFALSKLFELMGDLFATADAE